MFRKSKCLKYLEKMIEESKKNIKMTWKMVQHNKESIHDAIHMASYERE